MTITLAIQIWLQLLIKLSYKDRSWFQDSMSSKTEQYNIMNLMRKALKMIIDLNLNYETT